MVAGCLLSAWPNERRSEYTALAAPPGNGGRPEFADPIRQRFQPTRLPYRPRHDRECSGRLSLPVSAPFRHGDEWAVSVGDSCGATIAPVTLRRHRNNSTVLGSVCVRRGAGDVLHYSDRVTAKRADRGARFTG